MLTSLHALTYWIEPSVKSIGYEADFCETVSVSQFSRRLNVIYQWIMSYILSNRSKVDLAMRPQCSMCAILLLYTQNPIINWTMLQQFKSDERTEEKEEIIVQIGCWYAFIQFDVPQFDSMVFSSCFTFYTENPLTMTTTMHLYLN